MFSLFHPPITHSSLIFPYFLVHSPIYPFPFSPFIKLLNEPSHSHHCHCESHLQEVRPRQKRSSLRKRSNSHAQGYLCLSRPRHQPLPWNHPGLLPAIRHQWRSQIVEGWGGANGQEYAHVILFSLYKDYQVDRNGMEEGWEDVEKSVVVSKYELVVH